MQGYQYQSEFARKYYNEGRMAGREEGREETKRRTLHGVALRLAHAKLEVVTAEAQAAITAMCDERSLHELIDALGRARDVDQARAALDAAIARHAK